FASAELLHEGMRRYGTALNDAYRVTIAGKLGLVECRDADFELIDALHGVLQAAEVDMTIFFRALADLDTVAPSLVPFDNAFYDAGKRERIGGELMTWLERYAARVREDAPRSDQRRATMNAANPRYVLRNYLAQQAIDRATAGDESEIHALLD